jgi:hypothetical protein
MSWEPEPSKKIPYSSLSMVKTAKIRIMGVRDALGLLATLQPQALRYLRGEQLVLVD